MPNYHIFLPHAPHLRIQVLKFEGKEEYLVVVPNSKDTVHIKSNKDLDRFMDLALADGFKITKAPRIGQEIVP